MDPEKLLLDTHVLIWWATGARVLSRHVRRLIEAQETSILVSAATAWEIVTKVRLGKLSWTAPQSVELYCAGQGFERLAVTFADGERAGSWPQEHGDPFDRILAAQSEREHVPIATNDPKIRMFGVETVW